jgi:hypothetical protein
MTVFNDHYLLYCHIYLNMTNYCWKMAGTKTVLDRPPERLCTFVPIVRGIM